MPGSTSQYGLRAPAYPARHTGEQHVPYCEIAERVDISARYLMDMPRAMVRRGVLNSPPYFAHECWKWGVDYRSYSCGKPPFSTSRSA